MNVVEKKLNELQGKFISKYSVVYINRKLIKEPTIKESVRENDSKIAEHCRKGVERDRWTGERFCSYEDKAEPLVQSKFKLR